MQYTNSEFKTQILDHIFRVGDTYSKAFPVVAMECIALDLCEANGVVYDPRSLQTSTFLYTPDKGYRWCSSTLHNQEYIISVNLYDNDICDECNIRVYMNEIMYYIQTKFEDNPYIHNKAHVTHLFRTNTGWIISIHNCEDQDPKVENLVEYTDSPVWRNYISQDEVFKLVQNKNAGCAPSLLEEISTYIKASRLSEWDVDKYHDSLRTLSHSKLFFELGFNRTDVITVHPNNAYDLVMMDINGERLDSGVCSSKIQCYLNSLQMTFPYNDKAYDVRHIGDTEITTQDKYVFWFDRKPCIFYYPTPVEPKHILPKRSTDESSPNLTVGKRAHKTLSKIIGGKYIPNIGKLKMHNLVYAHLDISRRNRSLSIEYSLVYSSVKGFTVFRFVPSESHPLQRCKGSFHLSKDILPVGHKLLDELRTNEASIVLTGAQLAVIVSWKNAPPPPYVHKFDLFGPRSALVLSGAPEGYSEVCEISSSKIIKHLIMDRTYGDNSCKS